MKVFRNLSDFPQHARLGLYGAGEVGVSLYLLLKERRPDIEVLFFVDSYKSGSLHGVEILSPAACAGRTYDELVITSFAFSEQIQGVLLEHGIDRFSTISPVFDSGEEEQDRLLYAFYDRAVSPDGFDIINFLCLAEAERERLGYSALHVVVVPQSRNRFVRKGEHIAYQRECADAVRDDPSSLWYEHNILIPSCWMLPSCRGVTLAADRREAQRIEEKRGAALFPNDYQVDAPVPCYSWLDMVRAADSQHFSLPLRATAKAIDYVKEWLAHNAPGERVVSITLRESIYQSDRNSDLDEWMRFARIVRERGYTPVIIRDTNIGFAPVPDAMSDFLLFREAPWNMELRMAFYELCWLNLFTGGGPSVMANYNARTRLIRFEVVREDVFECSREHLQEEGLIYGNQLPGALPCQKTVWGSERCEVMVEEFDRMVRLIEN